MKAPQTQGSEGLRGLARRAQVDFAFWLGDLNYRLELPREEVIRAVAADPLGCYKVLQVRPPGAHRRRGMSLCGGTRSQVTGTARGL